MVVNKPRVIPWLPPPTPLDANGDRLIPPSTTRLTAPSSGTAIRFENGKPVGAPADPIIPFIRAMAPASTSGPPPRRVADAAVERAYGGERAGSNGSRCSPATESPASSTAPINYLPQDT